VWRAMAARRQHTRPRAMKEPGTANAVPGSAAGSRHNRLLWGQQSSTWGMQRESARNFSEMGDLHGLRRAEERVAVMAPRVARRCSPIVWSARYRLDLDG
jgi:hypothetical protein